MKAPRLLPLIAVAAGGVVAINALSGASSLPELFSGARAFAEDAVAKVTPEPKTEAAAQPKGPTSPVPEGRLLDESLAARPTGDVCATTAEEFEREAGLSPNELSFLQSLGVRRGQIEALEKNVDTQQALMQAAEAKVDAKIAELRRLIGEMNTLLAQADDKQKAETARLVKIYESMKPKDAAEQLAIMDDSVRLEIAMNMKERSLSAILGAMPPAKGKELTEKIAQRYAASAAVTASKAALVPEAPAPKAAPPQQKAAAPAPAPAPAQPKAAEPEAKTG